MYIYIYIYVYIYICIDLTPSMSIQDDNLLNENTNRLSKKRDNWILNPRKTITKNNHLSITESLSH